MERYGNVRDPTELERMPAWIVSLRKSTERREKVVRQMEGQSINYTFVDAIDGVTDSIPHEEVRQTGFGGLGNGRNDDPQKMVARRSLIMTTRLTIF